MSSRDERRVLLGKHAATARAAKYRYKARAVAQIGVASNTYDSVEAGKPVYDGTWAKVERGLGWPPGSAVRYLDGEGPLPASAEAGEEAGAIEKEGAETARPAFVADATDVAKQTMTEDQILARIQLARADLDAALDALTRIRGEGS